MNTNQQQTKPRTPLTSEKRRIMRAIYGQGSDIQHAWPGTATTVNCLLDALEATEAELATTRNLLQDGVLSLDPNEETQWAKAVRATLPQEED